MTSPEIIIYAFVRGAMLMLSVLGLESAIVTPSLSRWDRRFFVAFFAILALCSVSFFFELAAYVYPSLITLELVVYYLEALLGVLPLLMLTIYLLRCCGEDWRSSPLFRAMLALWVTYFILLSVAQFSRSFFYVTSGQDMSIGPLYWLLLVPILAMLILIAASVARRRSALSRQYYRAFFVCLIPVTLALFIHMFVPVFSLVDIGLTISAYSMYRIIVSSAIEQDLRQQRQIASQRTSIAVLQIRPHFIYNTMTSIYYLCDQSPKLAQQVILDFTTYLRKNFTAVASEDTIPFSEELEHTRAYLAVEQAQFEDQLLVDYDTPHTRFRMPPLTLQPIVENAVKHGMNPDAGALRILVRTRKTDFGSEVIVEDNGSGFESISDDEPHTALANIKHRLSAMCDGELAIAPREGGGTVVKVTIPQQG